MMSSRGGRQGKYQKHGYLIEDICRTYPMLSSEIETRILEFRMKFPLEYRDWYCYELVPAITQLQQQKRWSQSTTPESFHKVNHSHNNRERNLSRTDQSYTGMSDSYKHSFSVYKRKEPQEQIDRSQDRIIQGESPIDKQLLDSDSCYKKFSLPHIISKVIDHRTVLVSQGHHLIGHIYPVNIPHADFVSNLNQLKDLMLYDDKKPFYEYLQASIDQVQNLSERFLYQLVLLHLKLKGQMEPSDVSEMLCNEYRKVQGDMFLNTYKVPSSGEPVSWSQSISQGLNNEATLRKQFNTQSQDSFSAEAMSRDEFMLQDQVDSMSREQFISQDQPGPAISREQYLSQGLTNDHQSRNQSSTDSQMNSLIYYDPQDRVTPRLRKLLLNGSKHKSLQWAIENKDWVTALCIASCMDEPTFLSVCSMYMQSIPRNDPLRTCLQVIFGMPIDYQYSTDWGIHLAVVLNNTVDPSLILSFGEILGGVKDIHGQHVCYISARTQPESKTCENTKYVLLGTEKRHLEEQIPIKNIILTMAYDNTLPHLQAYKYYIALNYVKMGEVDLALSLLQNVASVLLSKEVDPSQFSLISYVYDLSLRLFSRVATQHSVWINDLSQLINNLNVSQALSLEYQEPCTKSRVISTSNSPSQCATELDAPAPKPYYQPSVPPAHETESHSINQAPMQPMGQVQLQRASQPHLQSISQTSITRSLSSETAQAPVPIQKSEPPSMPLFVSHQLVDTKPTEEISPFYVPSFQPNYNFEDSSINNSQDDSCTGLPSVPKDSQLEDLSNGAVGTISIQSKFSFAEDNTESFLEKSSSTPKTNSKSSESISDTKAAGKSSSNSWLSFLKFAKPRNKMILPDDTEKTIIWDEEKKMWINKEDKDSGNLPSSLPPPPKPTQSNLGNPNQSLPSPILNQTLSPALSSAMPIQSQISKLENLNAGFRPKGRAKYVNILAQKS